MAIEGLRLHPGFSENRKYEICLPQERYPQKTRTDPEPVCSRCQVEIGVTIYIYI